MFDVKNAVGKSGVGSAEQMRNNALALQVALWEIDNGALEDVVIMDAIDKIVKQLQKDARLLRKYLLD